MFEKNGLENKTFKYKMEKINSIPTKAYNLTDVHFYKRKKMQKSNFRAFIKGTSQNVWVLAGDVEKINSIPLAKFVILSICNGLDRAFFAYKDKDLMLEALEYNWEELHSNVRVRGHYTYTQLPHLPKIREIFDYFLRDS